MSAYPDVAAMVLADDGENIILVTPSETNLPS
jgi:hypothetical protein